MKSMENPGCRSDCFFYVFFPKPICIYLYRDTVLTDAFIISFVLKIRRIFQFLQLQIGADNHRLLALDPAIDYIENLFHGKFCVSFNPEIIKNQQAVAVQAVDELISLLAEHSCKVIPDSGKVGHQYWNPFFQQRISNASCHKGLSGSNRSPKQ